MTLPSLTRPSTTVRRTSSAVLAVATATAVVAFAGFAGSPAAAAAQPTIGLGKAAPYAILAATTVTNTGPSVISGSIGLHAGTAVTGFPPGHVHNGSIHAGDAVSLQAKNALTTAYLDAKGRGPATSGVNLGGRRLAPGVYSAASGMKLTGTVVLDAHGDPNAVFIFQAGSTLTTASNSTVRLVGGAQACHVFWQVGSSATLRTNSTFVGTVLALTSASLQTGTTVAGRVLARNGAVTLDTNVITRPTTCLTAAASATPSTTPSSSAGSGGTGGTTGPGGTGTPAGTGVGGTVPKGAPDTGTMGATGHGGDVLVAFGAAALLGAFAILGEGTRRRRKVTIASHAPRR